MGRVHRELLERFKRAQVAGNRTGFAVLDEMLRSGRAKTSVKGTSHRQEIKQLLMDLHFYTKPDGHAGVHIAEVLQIPNLLDVIVKEVECKKHFLRPNERPKLKLLALRYCVTEEAIRSYNELELSPIVIGKNTPFLYIPPSDHAAGSSLGEGGLIPSRISRSELTEKLRQRSRSAD